MVCMYLHSGVSHEAAEKGQMHMHTLNVIFARQRR